MNYPAPRLIFWETTAGCNLRCIHCRRVTVADQLLPQDLTTAEAFRMIDEIARVMKPGGRFLSLDFNKPGCRLY